MNDNSMAKSCGEDNGHEDCIAHVLKAELDKAKAVIADVNEYLELKAYWDTDVDIEELQDILKRGE